MFVPLFALRVPFATELNVNYALKGNLYIPLRFEFRQSSNPIMILLLAFGYKRKKLLRNN